MRGVELCKATRCWSCITSKGIRSDLDSEKIHNKTEATIVVISKGPRRRMRYLLSQPNQPMPHHASQLKLSFSPSTQRTRWISQNYRQRLRSAQVYIDLTQNALPDIRSRHNTTHHEWHRGGWDNIGGPRAD